MVTSVVSDAMSVIMACPIDSVLCLAVDCADFDAYKSLPAALSYNGIVCGLSGWNSDKCVAYFQSNKPVAYKVG
jgi:hypothetical protein